MKELGRDLDPRYVPTKFEHYRRRIAPGRAIMAKEVKIIN